MNLWTKITLEKTYQPGYLDELLDIYPIKSNPKREMPKNLFQKIIQAYDSKNSELIIRLLNEGVKTYKLKFPVECYYTSSLRNEPAWIKLNPKTTRKLSQLVFELDQDVIFDRCTAPKKVSRQAGPMFEKWFNKKFGKDKDIQMLGSNDNERKLNAERFIKYKSSKGLDVFIKINEIYILGEAKFITDSGGTQTNQFKSALNIINTFEKQHNTIPIAIVDGHCWRHSTDFFYSSIKNSSSNQIILSALLLEDFFNKIKNFNKPSSLVKNEEIIKYLNTPDSS